jgi:hypothetical protein
MPLAAQDAHVVPLSSEDAEMAKRTYEAMKLAETNWKMFQDRISKKYLIVQATDPDASSQHYTEPVSINGFGVVSNATLFLSASDSGGCVNSCGDVVDCQTGKPLHLKTVADAQKEEEEREARNKKYDSEPRQRKGFDTSCSNCLPEFDFS